MLLLIQPRILLVLFAARTHRWFMFSCCLPKPYQQGCSPCQPLPSLCCCCQRFFLSRYRTWHLTLNFSEFEFHQVPTVSFLQPLNGSRDLQLPAKSCQLATTRKCDEQAVLHLLQVTDVKQQMSKADPCGIPLTLRFDHDFLNPITQPLFTHLIACPSRPWHLGMLWSFLATPWYLSLHILLFHDNNHGVTDTLHVHKKAGLTCISNLDVHNGIF